MLAVGFHSGWAISKTEAAVYYYDVIKTQYIVHTGVIMYIEFLGAAGSGKTTVANIAIDYIRQRGLNAYSRLDANRLYEERTLAGRLAKVLPRPLRKRTVDRFYADFRNREQRKVEKKFPALMNYVKRSQQERPEEAEVGRRRVLEFYDHMKRQYAVVQALKRPDDILIFEEGFVNRVSQLHISAAEAPDPARVRKYLDLVPQPDHLIYVKVPTDQCIRRMVQRNPVKYADREAYNWLVKYCTNAQKAIRMAFDYLCEKGWRIIELDNSEQSLEAAAAGIQEKMKEILLDHQSQHRPAKS